MPQSAATIAQLEGFLKQDPANDLLRAEVFGAALRAGDLGRADLHLRDGLTRGDDPWGWRLRAAHLLIARRQWVEARAALEALRADPQAPAGLVRAASFDGGQVALHLGDMAAGLALIRPFMEPVTREDAAFAPVEQVLWLRLLHRVGELKQAVDWAEAQWRSGSLVPAAAGVASLAALDLGDLGACRRWSDAALLQPGIQMEALVARASVALGDQDTAVALRWLDVALKHNPADGRARSALGFAQLQAGRLDQARKEFEVAVQQMPNHIGTWHGLGWACVLQHDLRGARRTFDTALDMDRNFAESHGALAVVEARQGQTEAARISIERALRLDRTCLSAHYAQALLDGTAHDASYLQQLAQRLLSAKRSTDAG